MGKSKDLATLTNGGNIAGNFTVDTDTLHVDSTNDRIGFGTTSPSSFSGYNNISVKGGSSGTNFDFQNSSGTRVASIVSAPSTQLIVETLEDADVRIKTNSVERLIVDGSGRVTTPYQPYGRANGASATIASHTSGDVIDWFQSQVAQGGMSFSNSGRWTVPVAGTYLINVKAYSYDTRAGHANLILRKNGSSITYTQREFGGDVYSGRMDWTITLTSIYTAAANDYFDLATSTAPSPWDWYKGTMNNSFEVYLLG